MDGNTFEAQTKIPWYRTRIFWGVVYGLLFVWGIFFYFLAFHQGVNTLNEFVWYASFPLGSALFSLIGIKLLGTVGGNLSTLIYFVFMIYLGIKTFKSIQVQLRYPILFLLSFGAGTCTAILFLGSFA